MHHPNRQDNTYHSLCYTSRGALAGTRNTSMGPPHERSIQWPIAPWANALPLSYVPLPCYWSLTVLKWFELHKSSELVVLLVLWLSDMNIVTLTHQVRWPPAYHCTLVSSHSTHCHSTCTKKTISLVHTCSILLYQYKHQNRSIK